MATQVQFRRGTAAQNSTFTGAIGELTVDTTLKTIRVHDGTTVGGTTLLTTATGVATLFAGTDTSVSTTSGIVTVWNNSTLQTITDRGASTTNVITVNNASASTSTVSGNALIVAGGVGVSGSLLVNGTAVFNGQVTFAGTATYVNSTNTYYTDNIVEIHRPNNTTGIWTVNDGRDAGIVIKYYDTDNRNGFLGRDNATGFLDWYSDAVESAEGTFTSMTFGSFRTGNINLTSSTQATSTTTGAFTVAGGIGVGGDVYVGGNVNVIGDVNSSFSDDRLKHRLEDITNALEKINQLSGFYYLPNETAQNLGFKVQKEVGISAQQVQSVMPELVAPAPVDKEYLTVKYDRLTALLIEGIKELNRELKEIKQRLS